MTNALALHRAATCKTADNLGPLNEFYYVQGESYTKLYCCATILARDLKMDPAKLGPNMFQIVWSATQRFKEQNRLSSAQEIDLRRKHLNHFLYMLSQLGNTRCTVELQAFERYGFARIRPEEYEFCVNKIHSHGFFSQKTDLGREPISFVLFSLEHRGLPR